MSLKEVAALETLNTKQIHLHKEGLFWRAYELSAYLFVMYVKEYQPIKKYYKVVQGEVVYIGFPDSSMEGIKAMLTSYTVDVHNDKYMVVSFDDVDTCKYGKWKEDIQTLQPSISENKIKNERYQLLEEIASYSYLSESYDL